MFDNDVVTAGGCMEADDEDGAALPILFSPLPSVPPPPTTPPLKASLNSWDSMADLSVAEELDACCWFVVAVLPLGIPTRWLWLEWLVNRSFISS